MASNEQLKQAARRAYERGRLRVSSGILAYVVPATVVAAAMTQNALHTWIAGAVLAIVTFALMYRGEVYAKAVAPGLAAGLISAAAALSMCHFGVCDPLAAPVLCGGLSLLGGAISGIVVVRRALRHDDRRRPFILSAATVAFLAGALGCTMLGVLGVLGLACGVALSAVPFSLLAPSKQLR